MSAAVGRAGRRARPTASSRSKLPGLYGRSLHRDHDGEWDYDLAWKPLVGFPVRVGWLKADPQRPAPAARRARHRRCRCSSPAPAPSFRQRQLDDAAHDADAVLNVDHIVRWAPALGRHVTLARIDGGKHDLTLSREPARQRFFDETDRWLQTQLP